MIRRDVLLEPECSCFGILFGYGEYFAGNTMCSTNNGYLYTNCFTSLDYHSGLTASFGYF
jgi:hypothetical protein